MGADRYRRLPGSTRLTRYFEAGGWGPATGWRADVRRAYPGGLFARRPGFFARRRGVDGGPRSEQVQGWAVGEAGSAIGRAQQLGGPVEELHAGDVVWPTSVKHWHGAGPGGPMTHLARTGVRDGQVVEWLEHVTDEEYNALATSAPGS